MGPGIGADAGASSGRRLTAIVVGIGAGIVLILWTRGIVGAPPGRFPALGQQLMPFAAYSVGALLHVVPHELGHLVAALILRIPVLGVAVGPLRIGRPGRMEGTRGHVRVDVARVRHAAAARMAMFALAGPVVNLAIAAASASVAIDPSATSDLRLMMAGLTTAGLVMGVTNLIPGTSSAGVANDGRSAWRWITQPGRQSERIALVRDLRNLERAAPSSADRRDPAQPADLERLRAAAADPRPAVAARAVAALVTARIGHAPDASGGVGAPPRNLSSVETLWEDTPVFIHYAGRLDQPAAQRATLAASVAMLLSLASMVRRQGERVDPTSAEVATIARIAELGFAARRGWLPARTALALARLMQDRPGETRELLRNDVVAVNNAAPDERARAMAVWGLAELELGDRDRAERLSVTASRLAPKEVLTLALVRAVGAATDQETSSPA